LSIHQLFQEIKMGHCRCGSFAETTFLPSLQLVKRTDLFPFTATIRSAKQFSQRFGAPNAFDNFDEFLNSGIEQFTSRVIMPIIIYRLLKQRNP
jgi:hypothetical protein